MLYQRNTPRRFMEDGGSALVDTRLLVKKHLASPTFRLTPLLVLPWQKFRLGRSLALAHSTRPFDGFFSHQKSEKCSMISGIAVIEAPLDREAPSWKGGTIISSTMDGNKTTINPNALEANFGTEPNANID